MKSSSTRYGAIAITLHWLSAVFILALLTSGFQATSMGEASAEALVLSVHVVLGFTILVLTFMRIFWWSLADRRPDPLTGTTTAQRKAATVVHILFYIVTLGMVASGTGMIVLSGAGEAIFRRASEALPNFDRFLPRSPHGLGVRLMAALLVLHVVAALWHHFTRREPALKRMWYGGKN